MLFTVPAEGCQCVCQLPDVFRGSNGVFNGMDVRRIVTWPLHVSAGTDTDALVDHFARTVLLPENLVRYTFGDKRNVLTERELATAKRMYGIGKKYLMKRMNELGIINDDLFAEYMAYISQRFDLVRSSGLTDDSRFYDVPTTYEMRVARANAEGLTSITSTRSIYSGK